MNCTTTVLISARFPRRTRTKSRTLVLDRKEVRGSLAAIDTSSPTGLRDRALVGITIYTFVRIGAVLGMNVGDYFSQGRRG